MVYKLVFIEGDKVLPYGAGPMSYIKELLFDYLVKHNLYEADEVQFKIIRMV